MKPLVARLAFAALLGAGFVLAGCGSGVASTRPDGPATPLKEYKDMTKAEKIEFINKTPMPDEAKRKQIAAIQAGTDR